MANAIGQDKFFLSANESNVIGTTGTWAQTLAANLVSFNHTAAAETAVTVHFIPKRQFSQADRSGALALAKIAVLYSVGTADLSGAPTAVLDQVTANATTRVVSRVAATQTLAFTGGGTGGITVATSPYAAEVSITTAVLLPATDTYVLEMSWPCAATSVLKIFGIELYFQG